MIRTISWTIALAVLAVATFVTFVPVGQPYLSRTVWVILAGAWINICLGFVERRRKRGVAPQGRR